MSLICDRFFFFFFFFYRAHALISLALPMPPTGALYGFGCAADIGVHIVRFRRARCCGDFELEIPHPLLKQVHVAHNSRRLHGRLMLVNDLTHLRMRLGFVRVDLE
eukprot:FR736414.1.p1 GENE.FR736414.1~~FR736414.1.p1  ORF type:complete len:106 (-),score=17.52 FR736414.1:330-647(-)